MKRQNKVHRSKRRKVLLDVQKIKRRQPKCVEDIEFVYQGTKNSEELFYRGRNYWGECVKIVG